MPTMSPRHNRRKRNEGTGARVYYMPIGKRREEPAKLFPVREFLCSFDYLQRETDGFWPNATFETNRIVEGTEIPHRIEQSDIDHMKACFENRRCLLINQAVTWDWPVDWPVVAVNQIILLDESESERGFSDYYEDNEKEYTIFAEPYVPTKYDERWDFMYTVASGKRRWSYDWNDSTDTIRVRVMRLNHTKDDWKNAVQIHLFDINEYRRMNEIYAKQNADYRAQVMWNNEIIYGQTEQLTVLRMGVTGLNKAWNEGINILLKEGMPEVVRNLEDMVGGLASQFGPKAVAGTAPGDVPWIENIEKSNAAPIARDVISTLQRKILDLGELSHYSEHISNIETLKLRVASDAIQLVGKDIMEQALGLPPSRDAFLPPEQLEIAKVLWEGATTEVDQKKVEGDRHT